jgi:GWxTD domain-containing protein
MKSKFIISRLTLIVALAFAALIPPLPGQAKKPSSPQPAPTALKEKDLPAKYQEWLKLVSYIIVPVEKEVFMKLVNDRDRDIFIESFWKQRDPTPATPQNEYKDEHLRRFEHANKFYHRGTPRAGWMTDMGRIYIILGEPASIERFEGTAGIHTCQVWYFRGDPVKRLPTYFGLIFYQRHGSGEFKLYNPISDGPAELIVDTDGLDQTDGEAMYEKIQELAPTLANMAISLIPGQFPYNYTASPQTNIILADILESPKKDISPTYATHFLHYRGIVSTEYLTNFIESTAELSVIRDPLLGIPFVHFSMSPKKISIDYYEPKNQYYCNFRLNVSLKKGEQMVYQYNKDYPFYFPPANTDAITGNGVAVEDLFPAIEGTYSLTILLQNDVGKEFCLFEREVTIPGEAASPVIENPLIGYKIQEYKAEVNAPFKLGGKRIVVDAKGTLGLSDDIAFAFSVSGADREFWKDGQVAWQIVQISTGTVRKEKAIKLSDTPYTRGMSFVESTPAREFAPDYYEVRLRLLDGAGTVLDEKKSPFIVSPAEAVPHPVTLLKTFPRVNAYLYYYAQAYQYDKVGLPDKAENLFQKAFSANRDYKEGMVDYAHFLLTRGKYNEALMLAEDLAGAESFKFEYHLIRGLGQLGLGNLGSAVESFLEGNRIYNSDTRLLNALGECYVRTGEKVKALEVLKSSLRLNPDQKNVQDLIAKIEK